MNVLFVVQRYGAEVAGGAEVLCRELAQRLVGRGHEVSVLTSCARDYDTWADHWNPGTQVIDGVTVHRLSVVQQRDPDRFRELCERVARSDRRVAATVQDAWMNEQGPVLRGFEPTIRSLALEADVVCFLTYLYPTTLFGIRAVSGLSPIVVHPTAHDEWPMRLALVRTVFDHADGLAYSTQEEQRLVDVRFRPDAVNETIGIGFEPPAQPPDVGAFRERFDLGSEPYLLCLGRIDPNKGSDEAILFTQQAQRRGLGAKLVLAGAEMMEIADRDGLVITGFVDDATRWAALSGAAALIQPSRQESFGMTLAESWLVQRPVLVQGACDVTSGLTTRSGAGLTYRTFSEFDAAARLLLEDPDLAGRLGAAGEAFVQRELRWLTVLDRYERLLDAAMQRWRARN